MRALVMMLVLLAACMTPSTPTVTFHAAEGDVRVAVEIADEPAEWAQGLMFRTELAENAGMLFLFPEEAERRFWMKNTRIPLDMIFISADKRVVSVITAVPCESDPCMTYSPNASARYVVEAGAGFAAKRGIAVGDRARW